jgi:hypothetical protein
VYGPGCPSAGADKMVAVDDWGKLLANDFRARANWPARRLGGSHRCFCTLVAGGADAETGVAGADTADATSRVGPSYWPSELGSRITTVRLIIE